MRLTRADESFGTFIQGYKIESAAGALVSRVLEDSDGEDGEELAIAQLKVEDQYLSPDPEAEGVLTLEDEETLRRVDAWVRQLNAEAKSEVKRRRRDLKLLENPTPAQRRLEQVN